MTLWRILSRATSTFILAIIILTFVFIGNSARIYAADVIPDQLEFRRQAVQRMIFDRSQDIRLAGLWPAKIVGLDVMHPPVGLQVGDPRLEIQGKQPLRPAGSADSILLRLMMWLFTSLADRGRSV